MNRAGLTPFLLQIRNRGDAVPGETIEEKAFLDKAIEAERAAATCRNPDKKADFLQIAEGWRWMAERAKRRARRQAT